MLTGSEQEETLLEALYQFQTPEQVTMSDAGDIVYSLRVTDRERDTTRSELWMLRPGTPPVRLVEDADCGAPAFSPDGGCVAFLRSDGGEPQLCLLTLADNETAQLTTLPGGAGHPVWSPDGRSIAFSARVDREHGDTESASTTPIVITRLDAREDGRGFRRGIRSHLHVLDLATRTVSRVTDGDWDASQPAWSPDGTKLAFTAGMSEQADLTLTSAVYVVDLTTDPAIDACRTRSVGPEGGVMGAVAWAPDASALIVVGTLGDVHGPVGLLKISLTEAEVIDLAAPLARNVMTGAPAYPGARPQLTPWGTVIFCARDRGYTELYEVDLVGGNPRRLPTETDSNVRGAAVASSGYIAAITDSPAHFAEIATIGLADGTVTVRTSHNPTPHSLGFLAREEHHFTISSGESIHGWLLRAEGAATPGPLLLDIHGGPHNAWNGAADDEQLYHQVLARRGWTILTLNPRGSDGYGPAFFQAIDGAWGRADAADLLEPIDQLVAAGVADPTRLAVAGYSYGGYLTCYLTSRDQRFAAAVAGGTIADMTSMSGTSAEGRLLRFELGITPWDDREALAALCPYSMVERVETPTLLLHGADDLVCPLGQAEEWFAALRTRGVPSQLVVYPGGSHLFPIDGPPSHRRDYNLRIIDWLTRYVPATEGEGL